MLITKTTHWWSTQSLPNLAWNQPFAETECCWSIQFQDLWHHL